MIAADITLALIKKRNLEDSMTSGLKFDELSERAKIFGARPKKRRKTDLAAALVYHVSLGLRLPLTHQGVC